MPRIVNGRRVITDEPTLAPIAARNGSPVYWQQIRTLVLDGGEVTYGCAHCDYTNPNPASVRPHLNRHRKDKKTKAANGNDSVAQVLAQLAKLDEIAKDRDRWKQRAQKAERDLRAIRRAIGGGGDA
ncbi:hypothetical protein [Saccharopolyspora spinosa]|uniref:C2H2-type domain-containing protein n=1 Tax=Saccharopolyspora spinosa TaxID=60894 RepID=A0A2N3XZ55_SACSN|nr:hypothetical protein [Saccharopolyspora spinosa]PKW15955.1 hypothetical protein A8926_3737 [Saccharopolyspora spinosa]